MNFTKWTLATCLATGCVSAKTLQKAEESGEQLRVELAETYVRKGALVAALPLIQRLVAERPNDAHSHVLYATVLRERSLYPQAAGQYRKAIELETGRAAAHAGLALTYDLMKQPEDAEREHLKALDLAPKNAEYWNNFGFSLFVIGKLDAAISAFEHALGLDPSLLIAYNNLGFAYGRKHDFENARRCFHAALGSESADWNLALAYEQNGNLPAAQELRQRLDARRATREGSQ